MEIDWTKLLSAIVASGMSQPQVAAACQCGQSTISFVLRGLTKDPRSSLGFRLIALARSRGIDVQLPWEAMTSPQPQPAAQAEGTAHA
jgi:hypothetical protein